MSSKTSGRPANPITARIEAEVGIPDLASILATRVPPTDLQSLMLEVQRIRASGKSGAQVLDEHLNNRFTRPAGYGPAAFLEWDRTALALLPAGFEAIEISPVVPMGACAAVAGTAQDWCVGTVRNTEVVSDPTIALALEAAARRRVASRYGPRSSGDIHLCCSHRALRAQKFAGPHAVPHFRLFGLCSTGRNAQGYDFETTALGTHIRFYFRALAAYLGPARRLVLSWSYFGDVPSELERVRAVMNGLAGEFPNVLVEADPGREAGRSYYGGACFHIDVCLPDERRLNLVDGGAVGWMKVLLDNSKERCVTSGVGVERLCGLRAGEIA